MTNMNIPVAPGIGGREPLVIGTAMKLVLHHRKGGSLVRKSIMKVDRETEFLAGNTESLWLLPAGVCSCVYLCIFMFHYFHLLTCRYQKP